MTAGIHRWRGDVRGAAGSNTVKVWYFVLTKHLTRSPYTCISRCMIKTHLQIIFEYLLKWMVFYTSHVEFIRLENSKGNRKKPLFPQIKFAGGLIRICVEGGSKQPISERRATTDAALITANPAICLHLQQNSCSTNEKITYDFL